MRAIYCDESGFTGNNLLSDEQPFFVYSSVSIDSSSAKDMIDKAIKTFRLQMPEIKGGKLTKGTKGQQAALSIISSCIDHASILVIDKKFALAGKFYEYMFEPILASHSTIFYNLTSVRDKVGKLWSSTTIDGGLVRLVTVCY